jgi:hypothetical protein
MNAAASSTANRPHLVDGCKLYGYLSLNTPEKQAPDSLWTPTPFYYCEMAEIMKKDAENETFVLYTRSSKRGTQLTVFIIRQS